MSHAFPAAIAARDASALIDTLAPDVTRHSAVTKVPFAARVLRVTSLPLPSLLSAVDPLARWIVR